VPGHELFPLPGQAQSPNSLGKIKILSVDPDQSVGPGHRHDHPGQEDKGGGHCLVHDPAAQLARGAGGRPARGPPPASFVQTPKSDIYVALLGIALGAMLLGCLLLVLILNRYEFKAKVSALTPSRSDIPGGVERR